MFTVPWDDPIDEVAARSLAEQLLEYACNGSKGRPERGDHVYDFITENRDFGIKYSSCGDLAHWLLFRLGVRLDLVNRQEHKGWKMGQNVSKLSWCNYAKIPKSDSVFRTGDIIIIWSQPLGTDAHVMCVLDDRTVDAGHREIETANYGQPGGKIFTSKLTDPTKLIIGTRSIQKWLPLMDILKGAKASNLLVSAEDSTRASDGSLMWTPS